MTAAPKRKRRMSLGILAALLAALALAAFFLPGWLIGRALNQDLDDPFFASVSCQKADLAASWDSLSLSGLALSPREAPDRPLRAQEISIAGISRLSLLKALLGIEGDLLSVLGAGRIVVRGLSDSGPVGAIESLKLSTLALEGLSLGQPEGAGGNFDHVRIAELKMTGFDFAAAGGQATSFDSLAVFNLQNSIIGGVAVSGLSLSRPGGLAASLQSASLSGVKLVPLVRAYADRSPASRLMALLGAFGAADLASLSLSLSGEDALFLRRATIDNAAGDPRSPRRLWDLADLTLNLALLADPGDASPAAAALLEALGP